MGDKMDDWKKRLIEEHKELIERIKKLEDFLNKHDPEEIQAFDIMCMQLYAMQTYAMALKARENLYGIEVKED